MPRFDRTYRLLVGKAGGKGTEILPPLRMTFEVEKDTKEDVNFHRIRIWNLKPETRKALEEPDGFLVLYAGYAQEDGPLLLASGNVNFAYTYIDGPDVVTELEVLDGYVSIRDTVVSLGYGPGVKARVVLTELAKQMGLTLLMAQDLPDRTWQHGFSFYGAARVALHKIVQGTGLEWSIQNEVLQIIEKGGVTPRTGIVLAADSGLIGYPERTRKGAREKAKVRDKISGKTKRIESARRQLVDGWRVKSLLLPQINPGDLIKLESRTVTGWFRVETVRSEGDYGGPGDWQTELELIDRDAPPQNPKKSPAKAK